MPIMKTLNGYEVVDAKARQDIENIEVPTKVSQLENDKAYLTSIPAEYATKTDVTQAINAALQGIATAEGGSY